MIHESTDTLLDVADCEEDQRQVLRGGGRGVVRERERAESLSGSILHISGFVREKERELIIGTKFFNHYQALQKK